ncbi:MAG: universal stress protein [Aquihabitans sp.]
MTGPVLVGVDGSKTATAAALVAAQLARALEAPLKVVCVYEEDHVEVVEVGSDVFRISSAAEAKRTAVEVAETVASGVVVEAAALLGKPADALVAEAKHVGASVIVVGNRRMQGASRVLGSIANSVSHHAPCDVYIVKTT